jgi:hypothetical protein
LADYQLLILGGGGSVSSSIPLDCDDDYHALLLTSLRLAGRAAELWQSGRKVGAYAAAPSPIRPPPARRATPAFRLAGQ